MTKRKVAMQDIADRLQISKNSVSQALSGKDGVSEETRRKVIQTAQEMGYQYTRRQSSQSRKARKTIGIIAADTTFSPNSMMMEIFTFIEKEAHRHGVTLLVQSVPQASREQLTMPSFVTEQKVDGILILSQISNAYINKVISRGIPTVLINYHHPLIQADAVIANNQFGGYLAVKHLIDLDHQDIGIIGQVDHSPSYQERLKGYLAALREHDLEPQPGRLLTEVFEEEAHVQEALTSLDKQPSAWLCLNDAYGLLVSTALMKMGYRIPEDISVCGFGNTRLSQIAMPKLTTVDMNLSLIAEKVFDQLLHRIQQPQDGYHHILLPVKLVERESTGTRSAQH